VKFWPLAKIYINSVPKRRQEVKKKVFVLIMVLATVLVFGLGTAMADAILFPYWQSGGGYATFVQIINLATVDTPVSGTTQGKLHYVYVYNSDTETCQHYDDEGRTTKNDILLYEVTKQFYEGTSNEQLLPGDTTSKSITLSSSPKWGYLVVNQNEDNFDDTNPDNEGTIFGQEYVVNLSTGTIFALNAINDPDETAIGDFYFEDNASSWSLISWLPETYASTMWYVFPVTNIELNETDGIVPDVALDIGYLDGGVYDNNETIHSGIKYLMAGCWDTTMTPDGYPHDQGSGPVSANFFYTLQQILTGEQYAAVANTGGFTHTYFNAYAGDGDGYIYKLQSTEILGNAMDTILFEPYHGANNPAKSSYTK
jgi:hypothetical protein